MKKLIFVLLLLIGIIGFSAGENYETALLKRMEIVEMKVREDLDSGITADMKNATFTLYEAWDMELNKIYKLVMEKLPKAEKEKLRDSQREWVKEKERKPKEASKEFEGGTYESLMYGQTELNMIKDKTIELARRYDNLK